MLERLRGAARATQPRFQKGIFEMGHAVMNPLLALLEAYKNQVLLSVIDLLCFIKFHSHLQGLSSK